jgi:hypothetical protein
MPSSDRSRGRRCSCAIHSGSSLQLQHELRRKEAAEDEARQLIAATRGSGPTWPSEVTHDVDAEHALLHATTNEVLLSPPPTDPCGHLSVFFSARLLNVQVPEPAPARTLRGRSPGDPPPSIAHDQSSWTPSSFLPSRSHPDQSRPPPNSRQTRMDSVICRRGASPEARSAAQRVDERARDAAIAARRALRCTRSARYAPVSAPDRSRPVARRGQRRRLLAERSAELFHPDAGPVPTAHAPDRFELLRRAKDLVVGLGENDEVDGSTLDGVFCQFDKETGWPVYSMQDDSGPVPAGICKIDETAARGISVLFLESIIYRLRNTLNGIRPSWSFDPGPAQPLGISVRQLLVVYELVKRRCAVEGWTGSHLQPDGTYKYDGKGTLLTPETVTLYDLNKYVIMPATEAHQCSYVELVTGAGEESARRCPDGHVPMARTIVYQVGYFLAEEVSCAKCAKKLKRGVTYWVCHRCGDRHKLCGACAPASAPVKCAELQNPWWFVSHWYGQRRSPPQLAEPRTHAPRSKQVGGARL